MTNARPMSFGSALRAAWAMVKEAATATVEAVACVAGQLKCWAIDGKWARISGQVERVTEKAVLLSGWDVTGKTVTMWVPKSVIKGGRDLRGQGGKMAHDVALWFAEKNNMINTQAN
jgi:hypothetical protein